MGDMRRATRTLGAAAGIAGASAAEIAEHHGQLVAALDAQEALLEAFKSDNALLQNSTKYFGYVSDQMVERLAGAVDQDLIRAEATALSNAMLRFTSDPEADSGAHLRASLDRLARLPAPLPLQTELQMLVTHGRLIASMLPVVDGLRARLLATPITERARALQEAYLTQHGRAEARAERSHLLLYLAAVALLAYLTHLFLRLQARLTFERLIAGIAAEFVGLPREQTAQGIRQGLARLAEHLGADHAYVLLPDAHYGAGGRTLHWRCDGGAATSDGWPASILAICERLNRSAPGSQVIRVRRVAALPPGPDRTTLEALGVCSWLCVPLRRTGGRVDFLGFEARVGRRWREEDVVLLHAAGEIFAKALECEQALAKKEALEADLCQAQRMEAVGTLASGIAHDFNNILGAVIGYAEMALETLPSDSRIREYIQQIWNAGERARGVIDQIRVFSRRAELERRPVRLRALCEEAVGLLRASLPATIVIELHVEADASEAVVLGDPSRLHLVIINLCTNAAQAMDGRGLLEIRLDIVEPEQELALSHGVLAPGRYLRLAVTDTGHGIDAATAERIFEPFFTTKRFGGGTGLGLTTTHAVVADHGGALNLRSRLSEGSTFEVYLPHLELSTTIEESVITAIPRGRGEIVMLVDDERSLVMLGEEMLARLGYEPVGFDSAPRALAAFRADPGRFDLTLTDASMPEMTGTQLASELRKIRPDLPVVLMTGYPGPVRADRLRAAGIREILRKPLASHTLAESIARHLCPGRRETDTAGDRGVRAEV
jgi:signal transduction histidine kinase/ActR/RegA family two-component response regulator